MLTSVITGDIINSMKQPDPEIWLDSLKHAFQTISPDTATWEIYRGDSFQIEIKDYLSSFEKAIYIKSCLKSLKNLDVRLAIGIGEKTFQGKHVTESNGPAFQYSGETLESLKQEKVNLKLKSENPELDDEMNLYFKLISMTIDHWTVNSAEIVKLYLEHQNKIQKELADMLGINQEAVSKRMKRANLEEILSVNQMFRKKIETLKL